VIDIETGNPLDLHHRATFYPVEGGEPRGIPGLAAGLVPMRWTANGSSMYVWRAAQTNASDRVDLATGKQQLVKEIVPPSPAGILAIRGGRITPDVKSYV
jgi:hypothetical protein